MLNDPSTGANEYRALKSLVDNYAKLQALARQDPANPYDLPNKKALRVAARLESFRDPPTTIKGAAATIIANAELCRRVDVGANLSGHDTLFSDADLTGVLRNPGNLSEDEKTALRTLIDNYASVKAKSLAYAPNAYQLPSVAGLRQIAARG